MQFHSWIQRTMLVLLCLGVLAAPAMGGGPGWALAERKDDAIRTRIGKLREVLADRALEGEARILTDEIYLTVDGWGHLFMQNRVIEVFEPSDVDIANQEIGFPPGYEVDVASGFVLRSNGEIERLGESDIRVSAGEDQDLPRIVMAFPELGAGDVLGWSVSRRAEGSMSGANLELSDEFPVAYGVIRVKTEGDVLYDFELSNVGDDLAKLEVLEKSNRRPSDLRMRYGPLPADTDEIFAIPRSQRVPQCLVRLAGFHFGGDRWTTIREWQEVALWLAFQGLDWLEYSKELIEETSFELAKADSFDAAKIDAAALWVRDELALVSEVEIQGDFRDPDEVIESGFATGSEKTYLLFALLDAVGVPARLAFVRERERGVVDASEPGIWQFDDVLVVAGRGEESRYYLASDPACAPGFIPPRLRGGQAFIPDIQGADALLRVLRAWFRLGGTAFLSMHLFDWATLPGEPGQFCGTTREDLVIADDGTSAHLEVKSAGYTSAMQLARLTRQESVVGEFLASRRFQSSGFRNASIEFGLEAEEMEKVKIECEFDFDAVPQPTGDTWIVPYRVLFGRSIFDAWSLEGRGPFHVDSTQRYHWRTILPLPEGWEGVMPPATPTVSHERFDYSSTVHVEDRRLVFDRIVALQAGTTPIDDLPELDDAIRQVLEFEQNPMVLRKVASGR